MLDKYVGIFLPLQQQGGAFAAGCYGDAWSPNLLHGVALLEMFVATSHMVSGSEDMLFEEKVHSSSSHLLRMGLY